MAYKLPWYEEPRLWHMAHPQHRISVSPPPQDLFDYVASGGLVEAHNAFFERMIWMHVMVARYGWPEMPHLQWRCSAAKASAASLPRKLEDACLAMRLTVLKDAEGNRLMKKMMKPRKPLKEERRAWRAEHGKEPMPTLWHETEEQIYRNWEYCKQDVRAEEALSEAVPDLSPYELRVWQVDQAINERGLRFDLELAKSALHIATKWKARLNSELEVMTGIESATKRQAVRSWLLDNEGLDLPDTTADTVQWHMSTDDLSGRARRVCEILVEVNRTSTRKYQTMLDKADPDDWRVRDLLMYHGSHTGRWAGKGVQVHNFPARNLIVTDFDDAAECIKARQVDWCIALYGFDVMKLLSHSLRGAIIASIGKDLMVADYSAVEARCVLWLAGALPALEVFRGGGDIYCDMASGIYGYKVLKAVHKAERQFGKQAILGLGYGMGFLTFLLTCRKYGIRFSLDDVLRIMGRERLDKYGAWVRNYMCLDKAPVGMTEEEARKYANKKRQAAKARRRLRDAREDAAEIVHELALMKYTVDMYRSRYTEVKALWKDQEAAAIKAVMREPLVVECGHVSWFVSDGWLNCELPSGRLMKYRDPEIKRVRTSWGELRPALRYMSVNGTTRKWVRTATYGGKIVENITQAVARDLLADALLRIDESGTYEPNIGVHDEELAEVDKNKGSRTEFEELMSFVPEWADGCPVAAEAERYERYRK